MHSQLILNRLRSTALDNSLFSAMGRWGRALHRRWLALCFARRFFHQAQNAQSIASVPDAVRQDFAECLFRRTVSPRIHALAQLRIASKIASIQETTLRARLCQQSGWTKEQIGAVLIGDLTDDFSEAEKLVLRYAEDMTRTPIDVDPLVVKQLRSHFSQSDLIELTASIAHENFRIRFADAQANLH